MMPLPPFALHEKYMGNQHIHEIATASVLHVSLTGNYTSGKEFYVLLQAGFFIKCLVNISIAQLFYDQLKFDRHRVEKRISTIFLNGKPVDDITTSMVHNGSTLALSGAMPGLVGATLRKKSPLASFRQSISTVEESHHKEKTAGYIQVKLFNILLEELGPLFLRMGIFIQRTEFTVFAEQLSDSFYERTRLIRINEKPVQLQSSASWSFLLDNYDLVHLTVHPE